ncbi:hypothetical protein B0B52_03230 [Polaromonas sp. A23]|nr:hypothetical protein B0B52_03230 [Polaromonas sp. A23]
MPPPVLRSTSRKKNYFALLSACTFATSAVQAQEPARALLHVNVLGLQNSHGQVVAHLFREGGDVFGKPYAKQRQPVSDQPVIVTFVNLEPGRYALIAFHDINGNNDLDHNIFRLPAEPLGYSNGFELSLLSGLPDSKKLAFSVGPNTQTVAITVK